MINLAELALKAEKAKQSHKQLIQKIKKKPLPQLDNVFQELHEKAFEKINCLECGNCCRGLGPRLTDRDIEKLSRCQKLKPANFTSQYLRIDEDGDYIFKNMPCPFLDSDNYCSVYENRPKACREYPHTDDRKMISLIHLLPKNAPTCPAVFEILEELKKLY